MMQIDFNHCLPLNSCLLSVIFVSCSYYNIGGSRMLQEGTVLFTKGHTTKGCKLSTLTFIDAGSLYVKSVGTESGILLTW